VLLLLALIALGPPLLLGLGLQLVVYRRRGLLESPTFARAALSMFLSFALTIVLALTIWTIFGFWSPFGTYGWLFGPPWLSALLIFGFTTTWVLRRA
jgi:hypothetical protein